MRFLFRPSPDLFSPQEWPLLSCGKWLNLTVCDSQNGGSFLSPTLGLSVHSNIDISVLLPLACVSWPWYALSCLWGISEKLEFLSLVTCYVSRFCRVCFLRFIKTTMEFLQSSAYISKCYGTNYVCEKATYSFRFWKKLEQSNQPIRKGKVRA